MRDTVHWRLPLPMRHAALACLILNGCAVGPNYKPPVPSTPGSWVTPTASQHAAPGPQDAWWSTLGDPLLDELVEDALQENPNLRSSMAAVVAAREQRAQAAGPAYPEVDGFGSAERSRQVVVLPPGSGPRSSTTVPYTGNVFRAGFDASWELDLFGRVRRSIEAADAGVGVATEATNGVRLTLVGDVARYYVDARGLQERIRITRGTIEAYRDTATLTEVRYKAGTGTGLDSVRAEAQLQSTVAELPLLEAALRQDIYHLSVLTGRAPGELLPRLSETRAIPQAEGVSFGAGVPADIVRRRPDIREAERLLAQATATVGVATADLYPSLTLAGTIGVNSPQVNSLHRTSTSGIWSLGPTVSLPIFAGGRLRAAVREQEAHVRAAEAQYESVVLNAIEDVEDALTAYTNEQERRQALIVAVRRNEEAVKLSTELYVKGLGTFLDVLDSQRTLFQAQNDLAVSETNTGIDLVTVYKTLGGGWDVRVGKR